MHPPPASLTLLVDLSPEIAAQEPHSPSSPASTEIWGTSGFIWSSNELLRPVCLLFMPFVRSRRRNVVVGGMLWETSISVNVGKRERSAGQMSFNDEIWNKRMRDWHFEIVVLSAFFCPSLSCRTVHPVKCCAVQCSVGDWSGLCECEFLAASLVDHLRLWHSRCEVYPRPCVQYKQDLEPDSYNYGNSEPLGVLSLIQWTT